MCGDVSQDGSEGADPKWTTGGPLSVTVRHDHTSKETSSPCSSWRPSAAERVAERRAHAAHDVLTDAPDGTGEGSLGDGVKPVAVDH